MLLLYLALSATRGVAFRARERMCEWIRVRARRMMVWTCPVMRIWAVGRGRERSWVGSETERGGEW